MNEAIDLEWGSWLSYIVQIPDSKMTMRDAVPMSIVTDVKHASYSYV